MGSVQTTSNHHKRYRMVPSAKYFNHSKPKRTDRFRTTMRTITLRALAARAHQQSVSSSNGSSINNSSLTSPNTTTTISSQIESDAYLSDFDYRKLSTLTGLTEVKINELHREFLILSDNGRLTYERFKSMLVSVTDQQTDEQTERLARHAFVLFDKDGNNYLDFAEFIAAYITMEKNDLCLHDRFIDKEQSSLTQQPAMSSLKRHETTYYSPQRTFHSTSPMIVPRTPTLSHQYSTYYPQTSNGYIVASRQYAFR
jgi:Ca2+-binding EF-hand superfamily protein